MHFPAFKVKEVVKIPQLYTFFWQHYDVGFDFEGEMHNFWECVLVRKGNIVASADERIYHLVEGDIIVHKPLELHTFHVESKEGAELLIFSFSLESYLAHKLQNKVFKLNSAQRQMPQEMINFVESFPICADLSHAYWNRLLLLEDKPIQLQMLTNRITDFILNLLENGEVSASYTGFSEMAFKTAVDYMNSNLHHNISLDELAEVCHISLSGLKRIFTKFAGMGAHKYFLALKIKAATELLQSGMSVTETAEKLGFSSQSYFSATYKRETGSNPHNIYK